MKRFYDAVTVHTHEGGWQVCLDGRGIKTVRGAPQIVPTPALATVLAREWDSVDDKIDPHAFPMRDMADYAIDVVAHAQADVAEKLLPFADTDTLLYRADPQDPLYARQDAVWEPILTAFERRESVIFKRVSGVMHISQDACITATLRKKLLALDPFTLAALEALTNLASSLTISLCAIEPEADISHLWQAASLEEEWQASQWGRDEEAEDRRARRTRDFDRACAFAVAART